jgi:hypothetical protein
MTRTLVLSLALILSALPAAADCRVDYKAKRDNPLKLDFGTVTLPESACGSKGDAAAALAPMLAEKGWTLLAIVSIVPKG